MLKDDDSKKIFLIDQNLPIDCGNELITTVAPSVAIQTLTKGSIRKAKSSKIENAVVPLTRSTKRRCNSDIIIPDGDIFR